MHKENKSTECNKEKIPFFLNKTPQEEVISVPMAKHTAELIFAQEELIGKLKRKMNV